MQCCAHEQSTCAGRRAALPQRHENEATHVTLHAQGASAQAFLETWQWEAVAGQYAALLSNRTFPLLLDDPFAGGSGAAGAGRAKRLGVARAAWEAASLRMLDGSVFRLSQAPLPGFEVGTYALFVDVDIQACTLSPHAPRTPHAHADGHMGSGLVEPARA